MRNWKKKNLNVGMVLLQSTLFTFLLTAFPIRANEIHSEKYLFSFKSFKSTCLLRVNDLPAADNTTIFSRTMSAGFNLTAFLDNGENNIELLMGPQDPKDINTLLSDSSCQVIISKETKTTSEEIANFKLSVNDKGKITTNRSINHTSGMFGTEVLEGYTKNKKDYGLYKLVSNVVLKGLPRWSWVNAKPVSESDLEIIRKAYSDIWWMMKKRDLDGLKRITQISNQEMAFAEGVTTGIIFISNDFPQHVMNKEFTPVPIEWDDYKLITYRDGRLFRLGVGFFQVSPLQFQDSKGDIAFGYNPYFSIIDGKVTLVR